MQRYLVREIVQGELEKELNSHAELGYQLFQVVPTGDVRRYLVIWLRPAKP